MVILSLLSSFVFIVDFVFCLFGIVVDTGIIIVPAVPVPIPVPAPCPNSVDADPADVVPDLVESPTTSVEILPFAALEVEVDASAGLDVYAGTESGTGIDVEVMLPSFAATICCCC